MGDVYTVDTIIKHRKKADGTLEFMVTWQGYDASHNSCEPQDNILDPSVLRSYAEKSGIEIDIEDDDEPEFEVDKVLDVRKKGGRLEYQIQWRLAIQHGNQRKSFRPANGMKWRHSWNHVAKSRHQPRLLPLPRPLGHLPNQLMDTRFDTGRGLDTRRMQNA